MLRTAGLLVLLIHFGGSSAAFPAEVTVSEITVNAPTRAEHESQCGPEAFALGCTRFAGERATFSCVREEERWGIDASGQFLAIIVLRRLPGVRLQRKVVAHERDHIEDVRAALLDAFATIEQDRFAAESECAARVRELEQAFPGMIRGAIQASKRLRDTKPFPG